MPAGLAGGENRCLASLSNSREGEAVCGLGRAHCPVIVPLCQLWAKLCLGGAGNVSAFLKLSEPEGWDSGRGSRATREMPWQVQRPGRAVLGSGCCYWLVLLVSGIEPALSVRGPLSVPPWLFVPTVRKIPLF